jgi:tRNA G18 (ribose-2'-O)-methylase SpoU
LSAGDAVLTRAAEAAVTNELIDRRHYGVNHSLPVTVAAGIVMNEWARRKYVEGAVR